MNNDKFKVDVLHDSIAFLSDEKSEIGAELYFVLVNEGAQTIRFADLEESLIATLTGQYKQEIVRIFGEQNNFNLRHINTIDEDRARTLYFLEPNDFYPNIQFLKDFGNNNSTYKTFSFTEDELKSIRGFLIKVGNDQNEVILFKKHYPVNLLERGKTLRIIPSGHRFRQLEEDIININEKFDFMLVRDRLVVVNLKVLERFFGFEEIIKMKAEENVALIEDVGLVENIEKIREFATEKRIAKKLMRLKRESPVLQLPKQMIISFVSTHPKLKRSIRLSEDGTQIKLDTKVSMELFVKLLDDDYLKSELTELQYEALSKDPITEET